MCVYTREHTVLKQTRPATGQCLGTSPPVQSCWRQCLFPFIRGMPIRTGNISQISFKKGLLWLVYPLQSLPLRQTSRHAVVWHLITAVHSSALARILCSAAHWMVKSSNEIYIGKQITTASSNNSNDSAKTGAKTPDPIGRLGRAPNQWQDTESTGTGKCEKPNTVAQNNAGLLCLWVIS